MGERVHFNCIGYLVYTYILGLVSIILHTSFLSTKPNQYLCFYICIHILEFR